MEKCSISPRSLRVSIDVRDGTPGRRGHRPFSSTGEGYIVSAVEFQATPAVHTYGKINTAVVHNCRQAIVSTLLRIRRAPSWSSIQAIVSAYRSVCNRHCLGSCCCECSGRTRPWIRRYRLARIRDALHLGRTRVRGGSFRRCQPSWRTGFESAWWAKRNVMRCGASRGSREAQVSYRAIYRNSLAGVLWVFVALGGE